MFADWERCRGSVNRGGPNSVAVSALARSKLAFGGNDHDGGSQDDDSADGHW